MKERLKELVEAYVAARWQWLIQRPVNEICAVVGKHVYHFEFTKAVSILP